LERGKLNQFPQIQRRQQISIRSNSFHNMGLFGAELWQMPSSIALTVTVTSARAVTGIGHGAWSDDRNPAGGNT
jgi:hypothetical protein